jgi:heme-degrading monooxygenase HmoA
MRQAANGLTFEVYRGHLRAASSEQAASRLICGKYRILRALSRAARTPLRVAVELVLVVCSWNPRQRRTPMFARVTTVSVQPDQVANVTRIYNESILPAVKAASGNRGVFLLIDSATGVGVSITLWNAQSDGEAYDSSGSYREQVGKISAYFAGPPSLATYEVAAQG